MARIPFRYTGAVPTDVSPQELSAALDALRDHLRELQLPQIVHGRRAIIVLEGADGSGKGHVLRQLATAFDPRFFVVHSIDHDRREAAQGHWLARFWSKLPAAGDSAIFYRSWYRRVLDERILGRVDEAALARAFDEINEFEAQQNDYGTLIVKLFFDVGAEAQRRRLKARAANPWLRLMHRDDAVSVDEPAYAAAFAELRANSDTRWAPWHVIDADDDEAASVAALSAIADAWAAAMPAEPPRAVGNPGRAA